MNVKSKVLVYGKNLKHLGLSDFMMDTIWNQILPPEAVEHPSVMSVLSYDILTICEGILGDYTQDITKAIDNMDFETVKLLTDHLPDVFHAIKVVKASETKLWYIEGYN